MAEIKIYGTLLNDTAEPIAYAAQLRDVAEGKTQAALNQEFKSGIAAAGGKLQIATATVLGGVKSSTTGTTASRDYAVEVKADGTMKVNVPWANTTYSAATASAPGLMSAADKAKLDALPTKAAYDTEVNALKDGKLDQPTGQTAPLDNDHILISAGADSTATKYVTYNKLKIDMTAAGTTAANAVKTELTLLIADKINTATYNALVARVAALEGALTLQ